MTAEIFKFLSLQFDLPPAQPHHLSFSPVLQAILIPAFPLSSLLSNGRIIALTD